MDNRFCKPGITGGKHHQKLDNLSSTKLDKLLCRTFFIIFFLRYTGCFSPVFVLDNFVRQKYFFQSNNLILLLHQKYETAMAVKICISVP